MDIIEWMWREIQLDIARLEARVSKIERRSERAETAGGVQSFTYETRPLAANGGMSDGTSNLDVINISNGRKSGEGAGDGTGQMCYYDAAIDDWRRIRDDTVITA